jgi:hypothetical protein
LQFNDLDFFAMPQRIDRIVQNPEVYLDRAVLTDKPDMAILVTQIFATWASIEQTLSQLLVKVLGAKATPALAMYETLIAQHLQLGALQAAAKAALSDTDFQVFKAAVATTERAQAPRNQLAHWSWGGCKQRPDLLILANPKMLNRRDFQVADFLHSKAEFAPFDAIHATRLHFFDNSEVLAYSKDDLTRALRDLSESEETITALEVYLDPSMVLSILVLMGTPSTRDKIRAHMLQKLNGLRLFREALDRTIGDQKNTQPQPDGSSELEPGE